MTERQAPTIRFTPSRRASNLLEELYRHPLRGDDLLAPSQDVRRVGGLVQRDLAQLLPDVLKKVQELNGQWAEGRLKALMAETGVWSLDGVLVNGEGRMTAKPEFWSSFEAYRSGRGLPMTIEALAEIAVRNNELLFPLTAARDSVFFWQHEFEEPVLRALEGGLGEKVEPENFQMQPELAAQMPVLIRMARVRRNKVGAGNLASSGVVLGALGFWQSSELFGENRYTPRVQIERSGLVRQTTYFSPLTMTELAIAGGLPMNERHNVGIVRLNPQLAAMDFIAASFIHGVEYFGSQPFAFRYNPYRPWFGEEPKHGD